MAAFLDENASREERGLLGVVSLESEILRFIRDVVGRDWRVV
jgi:hypothetical protein